MKKAILFWLVLLLVAGPVLTAHGQTSPDESYDDSAQRQQSPSGGAMAGDVLFVRPFGIIFTAAGVVATVISLPFSIPSGGVGAISQKLIAQPFAFTFTRPLGVFSPEFDVPWN